MAISLQKGGRLNLTQNAPALKKFLVGLGWGMKTDQTVDLDASVFMLNADGNIPQDEYFVFYNNLKSPDGAIQHTGDNRTGEGEGDDELILADLGVIDPTIEEILVIVSIHDAAARGQTFSLVQDSYLRLVDIDSGAEVLRYELGNHFPTSTEVEFGRFHKEKGEWYFIASGNGSNTGLQSYVDKYAS